MPKPKPGMGRGLEAILAKPAPGMGRGLGAILSASEGSSAQGGGELRELPVDVIDPGPRQPRRRFDEDSLRGLAQSLRERGVLQPVLVRPKDAGRFELVAGERRWRAAQMASLAAIPALVRERADGEALELALIENMARADLSPIEEAQACSALVDELGLTREEVGRRVGRSRVAVSNLMRLLELPDEAIELLQQGRLSEGHGRALLVAEDHSARRALAIRAVDGGWSVRTAEARARDSNARTHDNGAPAGRLGAEVQVRAVRGGYRAELSFATPSEAIELARRLRPRAVA